jgi:hypothetical protein
VKYRYLVPNTYTSVVVDWHRIDADPDSDPDPTCHFDAAPDPDPDIFSSFTHVGNQEKICDFCSQQCQFNLIYLSCQRHK